MMKLSIIIPVYNVEQYLAKCLESVIHQDIPQEEYEIIVVNDGSTDGSLAIAEQFASTHSNIKVISRKNGGLSAARNTGLKEATGDYVWFIDSDDWIESNCLKTILYDAINLVLDVYCFCLQLVYEDGRVSKYKVDYEEDKRIYSGSNFIYKINVPPAACAAIYKRDFLIKNNIFFMEGILHEDQEFTPRAFYLAKKIAYTDNAIYNYLQREGSIMKSNRSTKRCKDLLAVADSLHSFQQACIPRENQAYNIFTDKINFAFSQSLAYFNQKDFPLSIYKDKPFYPLTGKLNWKYRLMNISLRLYLLIYKIAKR